MARNGKRRWANNENGVGRAHLAVGHEQVDAGGVLPQELDEVREHEVHEPVQPRHLHHHAHISDDAQATRSNAYSKL